MAGFSSGSLAGWLYNRTAATVRRGISRNVNSFPKGFLLQPAIGGRTKIETTIAALMSVTKIMGTRSTGLKVACTSILRLIFRGGKTMRKIWVATVAGAAMIAASEAASAGTYIPVPMVPGAVSEIASRSTTTMWCRAVSKIPRVSSTAFSARSMASRRELTQKGKNVGDYLSSAEPRPVT
jgi:hypothetical protein